MSSGNPPHDHHQQQQEQQQHQEMDSAAEQQQQQQQLPGAPTDICMSHHHHQLHLSHSPQDRDPGHGLSAEDIQELLGGVLDDPNGCNPSSGGAYGGEESAEEGAGATGGVDANGIPLEAKAVARSERKRSREKQRRSDVNKQFADLTEVLRRIEAELHAAASEGDSKVAAPRLLTTSFSPTNRVDLIARTIQVLTSLETVTKKQKTEIKRLAEDLEAAKQAGEDTAAKLKEQMTAPVTMGSNRVMMMVPMMIGGDQPPQPMMHPMMNPFMQAAAPGFMNNMMGNGTMAMPGSGGGTIDPSSSVGPWMNPQAAWMMQAMPGMTPMPGNSQQNGTDNGKPSSRATTSGNLAHCA